MLSILLAGCKLILHPWNQGSAWVLTTILWTFVALCIHNSKRGGAQ